MAKHIHRPIDSYMKLEASICRWLLALTLGVAAGCDAHDAEPKNTKARTWEPKMSLISKTNIIWGMETNNIKAGLNIQYSSGAAAHTSVAFFVVLFDSNYPDLNFPPDGLMCFPPVSSRYTMILFDGQSNVVAKTEAAKKNELSFDGHLPRNADIYHGYGARKLTPFGLDVLPFDPVILEDYFNITNAGIYHLKFVLNTYIDNQGAKPFCLPVEADIIINKP